MELISILAIFGLSFLIKESGGPWDVLSKLRNYLMRNKYVGVFFYDLLSCYFCTGSHAGYVVYLLTVPYAHWTISGFITWSLAGGAISFIIDVILSKLLSYRQSIVT